MSISNAVKVDKSLEFKTFGVNNICKKGKVFRSSISF